MTKFEVWKIIINDNKREAILFSEHKDLKTAYDMVTMLSDYKKDIRDVIADIDENDESMVGNIVDLKDEHIRMVIFNIEQVKE